MLPLHDENHVTEGLALRTGRYLSAANMQAALTAFLTLVQDVEDVLWDVINSQLLTRTFPSGTNQGELDGPPDQALLQTADLVGAPVGTFTTRLLAVLIKVWILARKSGGRTVDIQAILLAAFAGDALNYADFPPMAYQAWALSAAGIPLGSGPAVAQALAIARPPGVAAVFAWTTDPVTVPYTNATPADMFFLGDDYNTGGSSELGSGYPDDYWTAPTGPNPDRNTVGLLAGTEV